MEIEIINEGEMIRAIATGSFTLETAKANFVELMKAVEEYKASKVLYDGRAVSGAPTIMERYQYGEFCAKEASKPGFFTRFAYVMNIPVLDYGRFGETVAINRGMSVKATDSIEEAMEWLGLADVS